MTTTTNNSSRRNLLRRPVRDRGFSGSRDREIRTRSITRDLDEAIEEEPNAASSRGAFVSGVKATAPVLLALVPFALAFGTMATGSGLSALQALAMSVFVFAGAAQLAMVPLISAGASVAVIVLTVLVINLRMTLYSASLAPHFRRLTAGWKGLLSYLLTDQAYAATITRFDEGQTEEVDKRWYYLGAALAVWVTWQPAAMLGVFLGSRVSEDWSLDFVLPLTFIALVLPAIKDRMTATAALSAGGTAVFVAAMPLNLGLITAALVGVMGGLVAENVAGRRRR
ncbi:MAG TPA: AzlC family ABC transporter permease [Rubrobacteraceae bacterium]|nr:AzlC family ABC transporter permease [Rubrobacteraceae bacterium]